MKALVDEVRRDYQIPPYFHDSGIEQYLKEGWARLKGLNPEVDEKNDLTFRMLLKSYAYYAYHHKVDEWEKNYAGLILSWQLGSEVTEND